MLLPVVVTALLGSVFSRRLVPTITGTLLSALFVGFLVNGFQLLNMSSTLVSGVQGAPHPARRLGDDAAAQAGDLTMSPADLCPSVARPVRIVLSPVWRAMA